MDVNWRSDIDGRCMIVRSETNGESQKSNGDLRNREGGASNGNCGAEQAYARMQPYTDVLHRKAGTIPREISPIDLAKKLPLTHSSKSQRWESTSHSQDAWGIAVGLGCEMQWLVFLTIGSDLCLRTFNCQTVRFAMPIGLGWPENSTIIAFRGCEILV